MGTIAESLYRDSEFGTLQELPRAGSALEHPLVFDSTARDLQRMAQKGVVEIVHEHSTLVGDTWLIDQMRFRKIG